MVVCGVDLKASEARLAIVRADNGTFVHVTSETKKLALKDDRDAQSLHTLLKAIKAFAHQNGVEVFVIKTRAQKGQMAGGAISFKIETLFQLSGTEIRFISPQALAKFAKGNMAGTPQTVLEYQKDAFRMGAHHLAAGLMV